MNSTIGRMLVPAGVLCGFLLVGCDSVKDVREESFTEVPTPVGVLQGSITGLGNARAVVLSYNGLENCSAPDPLDASRQVPAPCRFFGVAGLPESHFSFGSLPNGTPYDVTVQAQPFAKICSVTNGSGTIGGSTAAIVVSCEDDPAVPRYDLTVDIAGALQTLPNLTVSLATEEDVLSQDATGQSSVVFPGVLIDTLTNLPGFKFQVTATTSTTAGGVSTENYCTFTPVTGAFTQGGQNLNATGGTVVPSGPLTVEANACEFTVTTNVLYHAAPGNAALPMPADGMELALRNHFTGIDEQTLDVAAFSTGFIPSTVSFPTPLSSHARSIYELVVTRQPDGMHCVVAGVTPVPADTTSSTAGVLSTINAPTASAVMLVDPRNPNWWAYSNRQIRCRALPTGMAVLTGTYQMDRRMGSQDTDPPRPYGRGREFLTFFDDGTFLYGINANSASYTANFPNTTFSSSGQAVRNNWAASSGVTHGFYAYDSVAGTIAFTVFTSTSINPASRGITGMPGYTPSTTFGPGFATALVTGSITAGSVVKGTAGDLGTLQLEFDDGTTLRRWTMTEPESIPGELTGTWVSADHRRMWAYNGQETYAFHMGVNGLGNLQDVCMLPTDDSTQSSGVITKHAGSATNDEFVYTCTPGIWNIGAAFVFARTIDLPHYAPSNGAVSGLGIGPTTPQIPPGLISRFPGMQSQLDNRPTSPVIFEVVPGTPDTLNVRNTLNGTPIDLPLTFVRERAN